MDTTPFTLDEANEIAEDFEDLIDTSFKTKDGLSYTIENVLVCPFNETEKEQFARIYLDTKNKTESLSFYKGEEFDVAVFTYSGAAAATGYTWFSIRSFAEQRGIKYKFI